MRIVSVLLVVCALLVSPAFATQERISNNEYRVLEKAYKILEKEDYKGCLAVLDSLLQKKKAPSYAYSYGALAYAGLAQYKEGAHLLAKAVKQYPEKRHLWHNLGNFQMQSGQFQGAVTTYKALIALDKDVFHASSYYHLAFAHYRLEQYTSALQQIKKVTTRAEAKKIHFMLQTHCQIHLKRWASAERTVRKIVLLDPIHGSNWKLFSQICINRENYTGAAAALEIAQILENAEKARSADATLKQLYLAQSAYGEAASLEAATPYVQAKHYYFAMRYKDALKALGKEKGAAAQSMETSLLKGKILVGLKKDQKAIQGLLSVGAKKMGYPELSAKQKKDLSAKEKRQKKSRVNAEALFLAGQMQWLKHDWLSARTTFKKLELVAGQEQLGKSLADCMQFYLDQKEEEIVVPDLYDPPLVIAYE